MTQPQDIVSFIPLGGVGDVTRNMYLYEYKDQILIVDCGIGFADETMLGVDLLLPDISYLLETKKKIAGMVITHGHEDHMGALPYLLPQLPSFPIYATPLTASMSNEKLKEFGVVQRVKSVSFDNATVSMGFLKTTFIRVTHSIPDTAHIFIETPLGNFYHGSDFKFDDTPFDGKVTEYEKIKSLCAKGVRCLFSDCLGIERQGRTQSEKGILENFEKELADCQGKFIVTLYSSHIARINQVVQASRKAGRQVCFVGRSLIKTKDIAKKLGYLQLLQNEEIQLDQLQRYPDKKVTLLVAGSQGQESSAMSRVVNDEHREIKLTELDTVIISADPIPGNEITVYQMVDTIAKRGSRVRYSPMDRSFHVSGHGSTDELSQLISLVKPKALVPIGGNFRHMAFYKNLALTLGYKKEDVFLPEDGQEIVFSPTAAKLGRLLSIKNVYVDEISGEELDSFVVVDRQRLSEGGIVIVLSEIDAASGQLVVKPDIIIRGFILPEENKGLPAKIYADLQKLLQNKKGRITNWVYIRKLIGNVAEKRIFKELRRRPLVLPVVIEV